MTRDDPVLDRGGRAAPDKRVGDHAARGVGGSRAPEFRRHRLTAVIGEAGHVFDPTRPLGRAQHEVVLGCGVETRPQAAEVHEQGTADHREPADVVAVEQVIR